MKKLLIVLNAILVLVLTSTGIYAQSAGILVGKIINEKNEPVIGASVKIIGASGGTTTDIEGRYKLTLSVSRKYELEFSGVGYAKKSVSDVELKSGQVTDLDIILEVESKELSDVLVTAKRSSARKESVNSLIQFQRNTNTVAAVVSAESIRKSPDRNTSEVLKRVSGASIQDGKYLIVRGLADRYNQATINGALMSSTEPDRKTFSFDIFPSNIIDNIIINKAATPEMPGEFAGGLVQLNTKDIVDKDFLTVTVGGGMNSQTAKNDFYTYKGGNLDFLGVDDGTRALPTNFPSEKGFNMSSNTQLATYGAWLNDNWGYTKQSGLINKSVQLTGGKSLFTKGNKKLAGIFSVNYNQQFRSVDKTNSFYEGGNAMRFEYVDNISTQTSLLGALANLAYQSGKFKLSWKNSYNITSNDQYVMRTGVDNSNQVNVNLKSYQTSFKSNKLLNSQLVGEHLLGANNFKLRWNGNISWLSQDVPDLKNIAYNEVDGNTKLYRALINTNNANAKDAGRFFSTLDDYAYGANVDLSRTVNIGNVENVIKIGGMYQRKDRTFNSRVFGLKIGTINDFLLTKSVDQIFNKDNYSANNFYLYDIGTASNNYDAFVNLGAGYLQFDSKFGNKWKATYGVRAESFDQQVSYMTSAGKIRFGKEYLDILPSVNLTYLLNTKTNIRLSGSKTVSRPEFREVTPFSFYDFEKNGTLTGEPSLERANITNLDLRYELYPQAGEMFTVAIFYKHFKNPIESTYGFASGAPLFSYTNAETADTYGAEIEFRKKLNFFGARFLDNFTLFSNLSWIKSEVSFDATMVDQVKRPMQGQSPYVINAGLQYDNSVAKLNAAILFNRIGDRIYQVGFAGFPSIYEAPRSIVDFQFTKTLVKDLDLKFTISDLLNQESKFYQDKNTNEKYDKENDKIFNSFKLGTNVSMNITYNF